MKSLERYVTETHTKKIKPIVQKYIIDQIDASGYDVPEPTTDAEKIKFLHDTFATEYNHEIIRRGMLGALREYYMGLPSCCTVAFAYVDIIALGKEWGLIDQNATEEEEDFLTDSWFSIMAYETYGLFVKYGVSL